MSWDVIGHEWAETLLRRHIADDRVQHAYLFVGPESVGKRTLAGRFAQALSCERTPGCICGECRACRLIPEGTYPDIEVLAPQPTIQVDDVRALQRRLALAPYEGSRKIALLEDFHHASISASNAMLKTLEEPPDQVVLLLTAVTQEMLLPTVVSRCEVIRLRGVPTDTIVRALEERDSDQAEMLGALSEGRPGKALNWEGNPELFEKRAEDLDRLHEAMALDVVGRFALAVRIVGGGKLDVQRRRVRTTLQTWLSLWRDLTYQGFRADIPPRNPDRLPAMEPRVARTSPAQRYAFVKALSQTLESVNAYVNLRLAVEALLLKLPSVE